MRRLLLLTWLTALWVLLWRDLSPANVLSGAAVAAVVLLAYPLRTPRDSNQKVHPRHLVTFILYFLWQVLTSNLIVARAVLSPRDKVTTGIVTLPLPLCSDLVTTVVANSLSLTPGTLTIEVKRDPRVIYLHVLHVKDMEEVREGIHRMTRRALQGLTTREVQAAFEAAIRDQAAGRTSDDAAIRSEGPA
jgi:multicomponent Na+:H+ antiporter subunit E